MANAAHSIAKAGALQSGGAPRFIVCVSMQAFVHVDKDTYRTPGNRARANIMHMSSYPLRCLLVSAYARVLHCAAHAIARAGCTTSSLCNGRVCQKKRTKNKLNSIRKMVLILVFNPAPQIVEVLCNSMMSERAHARSDAAGVRGRRAFYRRSSWVAAARAPSQMHGAHASGLATLPAHCARSC